MKCVVLIPGILGSILKTPTGDEVWPPTPKEVIVGYKRLAEIMRDDLVSTDIIRRVSCFAVYQPLIRQLNEIGFREGDANNRLDIFHYDWRKDLEETARLLSDRLGKLADDGATEISIVAHSMGGLVTRLTLEPATFRGERWFGKINAVMTLGTPHLGAPMAFVRILGVDGDMGISAADFKTYANDPRFPSAYQLLPAPGENACWNIADTMLAPVNIYDPAQSVTVGLDPNLVARTKWVHDTLAGGQEPAQARYFFFGGAGHKTCTRINVVPGKVMPTMTEDAGDGTVPMWSAFGPATQKQLVRGEHTKFFRRDEYSAVLYRLFGKSFPTPPLHAAPTVDLSVQAIALQPSEEVELLILSPVATSEIKGRIVVEFTDDDAKPFAAEGDPVDVTYEGPPVTQLRVLLPAREKSGHYSLTFAGAPASAEPVLFSVKAED